MIKYKEITGKIQATKQRENGYGIKLDGKWFNSFSGEVPFYSGTIVEITYEEVQKEGKTYRNIQKVESNTTPLIEPADKLEIDNFATMDACLNQAIEITMNHIDNLKKIGIKPDAEVIFRMANALFISETRK